MKAENRTAIADALLTIERRITLSTYWILGIVIGAVVIATAIVLAALQSISGT